MNYIWNVVPKTFTDEVGQSRTIVGITCRLSAPTEFNREEFKEKQLWIAFVQDNGALYGERNVSTSTFVQKMIDEGATELQAKTQVKNILMKLDYGTLAQIEANAAILAGLYGYQLQ